MEIETTAAPSSPAVDTRSAVAEAMAASGSADPVQHDGAEVSGDQAPAGGEHEAQASESGARSRGVNGRFAKPEPAEVVDPSAPLKAPQDWTGAAKAHWDRLPREVQAEARRLYGETRKTLDRAAALEKEAAPWREVLAPHEALLAGAGLPAQQVVGELLGMIATLQRGSPQERASLLAHLVRGGLGTDEGAIGLLAQALGGEGAAPEQPSQEQIEAQAQEWARVEGQREGRRAALATWQAFEATKPEFLSEPGFRQRLAAELSVVAHGRLPTHADIRTAYEDACQSHPSVRRIVAQRKDAAAAKAKNASTQSAAAGSGLKNEPAGPSGNGTGPAKDTREQVAREFKRAKQTRV